MARGPRRGLLSEDSQRRWHPPPRNEHQAAAVCQGFGELLRPVSWQSRLTQGKMPANSNSFGTGSPESWQESPTAPGKRVWYPTFGSALRSAGGVPSQGYEHRCVRLPPSSRDHSSGRAGCQPAHTEEAVHVAPTQPRGHGRRSEPAPVLYWEGAGSPFAGDHSGLLLAAQLHNTGVFGLFGAPLISWTM